MSTKHTPGPWKVEGITDSALDGPGAVVPGITLLNVQAERDRLRAQNAELVAALEHCQRVLSTRWFISDGEDEDNDQPVIDADEHARNALAKVKS